MNIDSSVGAGFSHHPIFTGIWWKAIKIVSHSIFLMVFHINFVDWCLHEPVSSLVGKIVCIFESHEPSHSEAGLKGTLTHTHIHFNGAALSLPCLSIGSMEQTQVIRFHVVYLLGAMSSLVEGNGDSTRNRIDARFEFKWNWNRFSNQFHYGLFPAVFPFCPPHFRSHFTQQCEKVVQCIHDVCGWFESNESLNVMQIHIISLFSREFINSGEWEREWASER